MNYFRADGYKEDSMCCDANLAVDITELVGFTLGDALKVVQKKGYTVDNITITSPPKLEITEYDQSFRVLRIQPLEGNSLTILVCKPL
ncbi:hypothetical protein EHE19_012570 [Ruminiclostridium herbifermentans]|uniref:PASTA domain-containing protein n=1 Tax=Ruminiclostridium herbifermentans TaxID=2488810 RepID=A0A4U7JI14_9FIRM|nr:hypothetical protein [Ruminiclostridium herbifermentans]QNU65745.1 hypothetical protein EHE19_012570 [Ruminiclostridium herbifermentans]